MINIEQATPETLSIEEFNSLSPNEKAILVAKDVINQLIAKKYEPITGIYVDLHGDYNNIKDSFDKISYCRVCAIGSCLISTTRYANILSTNDVGFNLEHISKPALNLLSSVFTAKQLLLIETSFEGYKKWDDIYHIIKHDINYTSYIDRVKEIINERKFGFRYIPLNAVRISYKTKSVCKSLSFKECSSCQIFYETYRIDAYIRMKEIMLNIIRNNGIFVPSDIRLNETITPEEYITES
jgi:hypothetical protein